MAAINHPLGNARRRIPAVAPVGALNWWVVGAILIAAVGAMLPVLQNSTATSEGYSAQRYQSEQTRLKGEISLLENDIAQLTSLTRVERRARELGLSPAENPIFVSVNEAGPAPAKIPSDYLPRPVPSQDPPEPWWRSLFSWVSLP